MRQNNSATSELKKEIDSFLDCLNIDMNDVELGEKSRYITYLWLKSNQLIIGDYYDTVINIVSDFDAMSQISDESKQKMLAILFDIKKERITYNTL